MPTWIWIIIVVVALALFIPFKVKMTNKFLESRRKKEEDSEIDG